MVSTTKEKNTSSVVEEELRRARASGQKPAPQKRPLSNMALGIIEIAAGIASMIFSFVAGALVTVFLGAIVLLSGILEVINGAVQRSTGHLIIGILGAIAGIYILANPLVSMGIVSVLVGAYLIISGIISAYRARSNGASMTGGIIEALLGVLVLFSAFTVGFLVGLYLIIRGILTYRSGSHLKGAGA
jgi:uncharacterized membrane protein HdeD (DUF308 family)